MPGKAFATTFLIPAMNSNVASYSSRGQSRHKTRSEAFHPLKAFFLWSVKTIMFEWLNNKVFLYSSKVSIANNKSLSLSVVVYIFWDVFSFRE
jgi:hypothetical protein